MSEDTQKLAEQIAKILKENDFHEFSSVKLNFERLGKRLDQLEFQIQDPKSKIQNPKSFHTSQQKFTNLEEIADEIIANMENEKACPYEPTGKPCDHCSMCNSLGF
jgi:hypothetical protein